MWWGAGEQRGGDRRKGKREGKEKQEGMRGKYTCIQVHWVCWKHALNRLNTCGCVFITVLCMQGHAHRYAHTAKHLDNRQCACLKGAVCVGMSE